MSLHDWYFVAGAVVSVAFTAGVLVKGRVDREWRTWNDRERAAFAMETVRLTFLNWLFWPLLLVLPLIPSHGPKGGDR